MSYDSYLIYYGIITNKIHIFTITDRNLSEKESGISNLLGVIKIFCKVNKNNKPANLFRLFQNILDAYLFHLNSIT